MTGHRVGRWCPNALAIAALLCTGCAPYIATCSWLEPAGDPAIEVVASRPVQDPGCRGAERDAPGQLRLARQAYVLEFWTGDRWYAELLVRARTPSGEPLVLRSAVLRSLAAADPTYRVDKWREFDYLYDPWLLEPDLVDFRESQVLSLAVVANDGSVLGSEQVTLVLKSRRGLAFEFI